MSGCSGDSMSIQVFLSRALFFEYSSRDGPTWAEWHIRLSKPNGCSGDSMHAACTYVYSSVFTPGTLL